MTDVIVATGPVDWRKVHWLEIWDAAAEENVAQALGVALPGPGRVSANGAMRVLRHGPGIWLVRGTLPDLAESLGEGGAMTEVGGGLVCLSLQGPDWRDMLMADGLFDAENPAFGPGCCATTLIAHVRVHCDVVSETRCDVLVPASFADHLRGIWASHA